MAYKTGYFSVKSILSDFIGVICFENPEMLESWQLVYPNTSDFEEAKKIIDKERRATISTTFIPPKQWIKKEPIIITKNLLNSQTGDTLIIALKNTISVDGDIKVYTKRTVGGMFYRMVDDIDKTDKTLDIIEYSVSLSRNSILLSKKNFNLADGEEVYLYVDYQAIGEQAVTWFVDFDYPELNEVRQKNYSYFQWTFGKKVDRNGHVINNRSTPIKIRSYWHSSLSNSYISDWLPINYFITWDLYSIAFVFCEEPITDLNKIQHSFNYIGMLENIEGAEYDDIENNFGSCGAIDSKWKDIIPSGEIVDFGEETDTANFTIRKVFYDGKYQPVRSEVLLNLNSVALANYVVGNEFEGDYNLISPKGQEIYSSPIYPISELNYPAPDSYFETEIVSRPDVTQTYSEPIFIIPRGIELQALKINNDNLKNDIRYITTEEIEVKFQNSGLRYDFFIEATKNDPMYLENEAEFVDQSTEDTVILPKMTKLILKYYDKKNVTVSITSSGKYNFNPTITGNKNTIVAEYSTGKEYQLIDGRKYTIRPSIIELCASNSGYILNKSTNLKNISRATVREDFVQKGTVLTLSNNIRYVKYKINRNITIDFQYKEPSVGNLKTYVNTVGYNGNIIGGKMYGFNNSPIRPVSTSEKLRENSPFLTSVEFTKEGTIKTTQGTNVVISNLIQGGSLLENNTGIMYNGAILNIENHKMIVSVPEIITTSIGQKFKYTQTQLGNSEINYDKEFECVSTYPNQHFERSIYLEKIPTSNLYINIPDGGTENNNDAVRVVFLTPVFYNGNITGYKPILGWKESGTFEDLEINYTQDGAGLNINISKKSTSLKYYNIIIGYFWVKESAIKETKGSTYPWRYSGNNSSIVIGNRYKENYKDIILNCNVITKEYNARVDLHTAHYLFYNSIPLLEDLANFTVDDVFLPEQILRIGEIQCNKDSFTLNSKNYTGLSLNKDF